MALGFDICIVGGCGHVGLPLGIAFAETGKRVALYDINAAAVKAVNAGMMPFKEEGGEAALKRVLKSDNLRATSEPKTIALASVVILVVGTPVDEHLNPQTWEVMEVVKDIAQSLRGDQLLVLRSTLYPGMTEKIWAYLRSQGKETQVAYCPERIVEGRALAELQTLPQIVGGCTDAATEAASELFGTLTHRVIVASPTEAEMAKIFTNSWRYLNFAISNQFYMIADSHGLDFYKIYQIMTDDYPRLKSFARAGFAAGPCLFKDTMQLSAFSGNDFFLGHAAMLINEGMPDYIVSRMKETFDLSQQRVAIIGMAFKAESDDPNESLSYKLRKKLAIEVREVMCHDPYIKDERFTTLEEIHKRADIVVVGAPHAIYAREDWSGKAVIDIWNFYQNKET